MGPDDYVPIVKLAAEFLCVPNAPLSAMASRLPAILTVTLLCSQDLGARYVPPCLDGSSHDCHLLPPHFILPLAQKVLSPGTVPWGLSFKEQISVALRLIASLSNQFSSPLCSLLSDRSHSLSPSVSQKVFCPKKKTLVPRCTESARSRGSLVRSRCSVNHC